MSPAWSAEEVPELRGLTVEWAEPGRLILSRRNDLFQTEGPGGPLRLLGSFPAPAWKALAARSRIAQRLLRFLFYNVLALDGGVLFVTFDKHAGIHANGRFTLLEGLVRPCRVLRGACAVDSDGSVYFGEYLMNAERGPMRVYRCHAASSRAEVVHAFSPGSIRHVHGIYHDPYTNALWCVTGDGESECRMLRTFDGFKTLEEVGGGDETWRCVSLLFAERSVYYASDAEYRENVIYRLDRATGVRTVIQRIDGPVYYTTAVGEDRFFAVTAELCPSQESRKATLWHADGHDRVERVASFSKDRLPVAYFLPGTLHFPRGPGLRGELFFHTVGFTGSDNRTYRARPVSAS